MSIQNLPVIGDLVQAVSEKKTQHEKAKLQRQGLSTERTKDRPFKDWSDNRLRHESHALTMRIRAADSGFGLSPLIDRGWLMDEELRERGLEDTIPGGDQLEQIEAELEARSEK